MGLRERYEHGVFCWVDLMTADPVAAKQFYTALFGWEFVDVPVDNGSTYSMALKNQRNVAALFALPEMMQQQQMKTRRSVSMSWPMTQMQMRIFCLLAL